MGPMVVEGREHYTLLNNSREGDLVEGLIGENPLVMGDCLADRNGKGPFTR